MMASGDLTTPVLLTRFDALLDDERAVIANGDYDALTTISNQKLALLGALHERTIDREASIALRGVLEKSAENGLMVESALRFWRGAHQRLMRLQGQTGDAPLRQQKNAYILYRERRF